MDWVKKYTLADDRMRKYQQDKICFLGLCHRDLILVIQHFFLVIYVNMTSFSNKEADDSRSGKKAGLLFTNCLLRWSECI